MTVSKVAQEGKAKAPTYFSAFFHPVVRPDRRPGRERVHRPVSVRIVPAAGSFSNLAAPLHFSWRMMFDPVARDIDPPADPDPIVLFDVVEEALQGGKSSRSAQQPAVH